MVQTVEHEAAGAVKLAASPIQFVGEQKFQPAAPPILDRSDEAGT